MTRAKKMTNIFQLPTPKKALTVIVLITLLSNCTLTLPHYIDYQKKLPIVISTLVGETIDPEEREKFDLFHGIDDFKSATFYAISNGGYEVEIITENAKLASVNRDSNAILIMKEYIDTYEDIRDSRKEFDKKWNIVDYDELGQPITTNEINRVKGADYRVGCVGSCLMLGVLSLIFLDMVPHFALGPSKVNVKDEWYYLVIGGTIVGVATGVLEGHHADILNALEAIKKARQPRVIEQF